VVKKPLRIPQCSRMTLTTGACSAAAHTDDLVPLGVELLQVDRWQQHRIGIVECLARRADEHVPGAAVDVRLRASSRRRAPAALDYQIDSQRAPIRQSVRDVKVRDRTIADKKGHFLGTHGLGPAAVAGVDCEERGERRQILDVRDRHRREVTLTQRRTQCRTPDPTETMNSDTCHLSLLVVQVSGSQLRPPAPGE